MTFNIHIWKPFVKSHKQHLLSFWEPSSISLDLTIEIIYQVLIRNLSSESVLSCDHINVYRDVVLHKTILDYLTGHNIDYIELPLSATVQQKKMHFLGRIGAKDKLATGSQNLPDLRIFPKEEELSRYMKEFFFESMCIVHSSDGNFPDHKTLAERVNLGGLLPVDLDVNWLLYHLDHVDDLSLSISKKFNLENMLDDFRVVALEHELRVEISDHIVDWDEWHSHYNITL